MRRGGKGQCSMLCYYDLLKQKLILYEYVMCFVIDTESNFA